MTAANARHRCGPATTACPEGCSARVRGESAGRSRPAFGAPSARVYHRCSPCPSPWRAWQCRPTTPGRRVWFAAIDPNARVRSRR